MRALRYMAACVLAAGCTNLSIEPADDASPFSRALLAEYEKLAEAEYAETDLADARLFHRKAKQAARGESPAPDDLSGRDLPAAVAADAEVALDLLGAVLLGAARLVAPETLARAQASFDCWVQEAEEDRQPDEIEACREAFYAALAEVEKIESGALVVLLPSDEPSAIEVSREDKAVRLDSAYAAAASADLANVAAVDASETGRVLSEALAAAPQPQRSYLVYFQEGSSDLTPESEQTLQDAIDDALATEAVRVTVFGHTDRQGPASVNVRLARSRAEGIRGRIIEAGIAADLIDADSFGESFPLVPTEDGVPEPRNRRVEIAVR